MATVEQKFCDTCHRTTRITNYYKSHRTNKYPDGYLNTCKNCLTIRVDNWDPQTYVWILEECDVPYIPDEWTKLLASFGKDPTKLTGLTIIGRYLAKMQLKQFRDYRWADSEFIQQLADQKTEQAMKRQGYGAVEIAQVLNENRFETPEGGFQKPDFSEFSFEEQQPQNEDFDFLSKNNETEIAFINELTEEDKTYLLLKWGKSYKPSEWIQLERLYQEMMNSYDINAAGDINSLILACKSSLKANQLIDMNDIDGAQKVSKMYDSLMKAGKWTAAANKAEAEEYLDSIGELVAICEADGFFPRYYVDSPKDKVDKVIMDNQKYLHDLVTEENGLTNLIELAVKQIQTEKEAIAAAASMDEESAENEFENALFDYTEKIMEEKDYTDFNEFVDQEQEEDNNGVS